MTQSTDADITQSFKAELREQHRNCLRGAKWLAEAAAQGDVERFLAAVDYIAEETVGGGWRVAMRRIGRLHAVPTEIQHAFVDVWIPRKSLPQKVGHRPTTAKALRILLPRTQVQEPMRLFRGAGARERKVHTYGFSWTTDCNVARLFAAKQLNQGVVLETLAPPEAILFGPENYYEEEEVIVDPYLLGPVQVVERVPGINPKPLSALTVFQF